MDVITLAMAKPKILDLTKFTTDTEPYQGYSLSDLVLSLIQQSVTSGSFAFAEPLAPYPRNMREQATTDKDVYIIKTSALGSEMRFPASYVENEQGAEQLSANGIMEIAGVGFAAINMVIRFRSSYISIGVKATVL